MNIYYLNTEVFLIDNSMLILLLLLLQMMMMMVFINYYKINQVGKQQPVTRSRKLSINRDTSIELRITNAFEKSLIGTICAQYVRIYTRKLRMTKRSRKVCIISKSYGKAETQESIPAHLQSWNDAVQNGKSNFLIDIHSSENIDAVRMFGYVVMDERIDAYQPQKPKQLMMQPTPAITCSILTNAFHYGV